MYSSFLPCRLIATGIFPSDFMLTPLTALELTYLWWHQVIHLVSQDACQCLFACWYVCLRVWQHCYCMALLSTMMSSAQYLWVLAWLYHLLCCKVVHTVVMSRPVVVTDELHCMVVGSGDVICWCLLMAPLFAPADSSKMAYFVAVATSFVICWGVDVATLMLYSWAFFARLVVAGIV